MWTAHIEIGTDSAGLLIFNGGEQAADINLIWTLGGCDGTPTGRADVLLRQNGYARTSPWVDNGASIDVVGPVGQCSCWKSGARMLIDDNCQDHGTSKGTP